MNDEAYEINEHGFIVNNYLIGGDVEIPARCIYTQLPYPAIFHKNKWSGEEWTEGATPEELAEMTKPKEAPLTDIEVLSRLLTERELELMLQGQQLVALELKFSELEAKLNV